MEPAKTAPKKPRPAEIDPGTSVTRSAAAGSS